MFDAIQLQNRMKTVPSTEFQKPRLAWRAWLSLAPVLALVVIGSWIVYQERKLARQEAYEIIQKAASRAIKRVDHNLRWAHSVNPQVETPVFPQQSPYQMHLLIDPTGECLLPEWPIAEVLPDPKPLPWEGLSEFESVLWQQAHSNLDLQMAHNSAEVFQKQNPPEPFDALMAYRKLVLMLRLGRFEETHDLLKSFRETVADDVLIESGMPLKVALDFLELQLIEPLFDGIPDGIRRKGLLGAHFSPMASRLSRNPNPWTKQIVKCFIEVEQKVGEYHYGRSILNYLDQTEVVRGFYRLTPKEQWGEWAQDQSFKPRWVDLNNSSYLLLRSKGTVEKSIFLLTEKQMIERSVGQWLREGLGTIGDASLFQLTIEIAGRDILTLPPKDGSWFDDETSESTLEPMEVTLDSETSAPVRLRCVLKNPESYFARSRQRTRSMLWLIGLAGVTGLVGWVAQWKAFRRQVELGRMKSNFVASVSHELRAPIASIRLMTENLSYQKGRTDAERQDYFQWIGLECRRLSALVQNILQFSRLELGKRDYSFEAVDITRLFEETLRLMEPLAASVQVKLQSEVRHLSQSDNPALPDAMWDGQAIHQALVNLIDNAVKHTAKGGVVRAELSFRAENACVDFCVIDQGPGIEPADRERIFKPFERLGSEMTRKTKGVGIGLNLVWHTAQAHQGSVRVEQAPDGGACFVLSLPLQPKQKGML
jgi:signal transduction histidine kinase